jgi:hypothetical protein
MLIITLTSIFGPALAQGPPIRNDWVVSDSQTLSGTSIWNGNITVEGGGELTISSAIILFNSTNASHKGIFVREGGKIKVLNTRITTINKSEGFMFLANGSVEIKNSKLEYVYGDTYGIVWIGGFRVMSDNPVVEDSQFIDATGFGPRFEGCDNVVFRNNLVTESSTGILFEGSNGLIEGNVFTNNSDRQVVIRDCENVRFIDNTLNLTGMGGLIIARTKKVETSGNVYDGAFYVIYASNRSTLSMDGEYITGDQIQVEANENSHVTITDSTLEIDKINAVSGSSVKLDRNVKIRVVSGKGNPVSGVIVKATDPQKVLVANGTTNDEGIVQFSLRVATVSTNQFKPNEPVRELHGPYTFKALKGIYSASGTANITANYNLEMELKLPWLFIGGAAVVIVLIIVIVFAPPSGSRSKSKKQ